MEQWLEPALPRSGYCPNLDSVAGEDFNKLLALTTEPQAGMTLLDYYIGQALAGILANPGATQELSIQLAGGESVEDALGTLSTSIINFACATLARRDELLRRMKVEARRPQPEGDDEHGGDRGGEVADASPAAEVRPPEGTVPGPAEHGPV